MQLQGQLEGIKSYARMGQVVDDELRALEAVKQAIRENNPVSAPSPGKIALRRCAPFARWREGKEEHPRCCSPVPAPPLTRGAQAAYGEHYHTVKEKLATKWDDNKILLSKPVRKAVTTMVMPSIVLWPLCLCPSALGWWPPMAGAGRL